MEFWKSRWPSGLFFSTQCNRHPKPALYLHDIGTKMIDLDKLLHIKRDKQPPAQGKVLISNPLLNDFFFRRSVVLLVDHGEEGSFGVILNKPLDLKLQDVTTAFSALNTHVYLGGPVKADGMFFLHRLGGLLPGSVGITQGLWWGGDTEILEQILSDPTFAREDHVRFYLGYAGWVTGQLDQEMQNKSWVLADIDPDEVIGKASTDLWTLKVKSLGKEYDPWLRFPADPSLN